MKKLEREIFAWSEKEVFTKNLQSKNHSFRNFLIICEFLKILSLSQNHKYRHHHLEDISTLTQMNFQPSSSQVILM